MLPATIAIEAHLTTEASLVLADAAQLPQIVMNLGANAEYAMRDTGRSLDVGLAAVEVDAALAATHAALHPRPYVRLSVRDNGRGALSVVHGIVANHGGAILVESTLGQGTTFTIYLPRLAPRVERDAPPAAEDSLHTNA